MAAGQEDDGLSLIEVIVSLLVFALISTGVLAMMLRGIDMSRTNRNRASAANLAAQDLDQARDTDPATLAAQGLSSRVQTVDGVTYTIQRHVQWESTGATTGPCGSGSSSRQSYLRVDTSVTWPRMSGVAPVTNSTLIYPKVGEFDSNTGSIAVLIQDRNGTPEASQPVSLTGPGGTFSQTTSTDGCAFFAYLPAGSYTTTVSSTGYVDPTGAPAPSTATSVSVGQKSTVTFSYDQAATLTVNLAAPTGSYTYAIPDGMPVRFGNGSGVFPYGVAATVTATGTSLSDNTLFPFTDGYTIWAGSCADSDPGVNNRGAAVSAPPAGTTSTTLTVPGALDVRYTSGGKAVAGKQLYAVHAGENTPGGCASGLTLNLGTTDSTGYVHVALPYGTWTISTNSNGSNGKQVTLTQASPRGSVTFP